MPKVTIEFNLPDEAAEYQTTVRAAKYSVVIWEFLQWLRQKYKYEEIETLETEVVRAKMFELINDEGIGDEF